MSHDEQRAFLVAVAKLADGLRVEGGFRPSLRAQGTRGAAGVFEMTWAPDGRATFSYGRQVIEGEPHVIWRRVIWRRVGTHEILRGP